MNDLETRAAPLLKPMIDNKSTSLTPEDDKLLALWAVKTSMMLALTWPGMTRVPEAHFGSVRNELHPPDSSFVRLSAYDGETRVAFNYHQPLAALPESGANAQDGYCSTLLIGAVVLQTFAFEDIEGFTMEATGTLADFFIPLWPLRKTSSPRRWPPLRSFDNDGFREFLNIPFPVINE